MFFLLLYELVIILTTSFWFTDHNNYNSSYSHDQQNSNNYPYYSTWRQTWICNYKERQTLVWMCVWSITNTRNISTITWLTKHKSKWDFPFERLEVLTTDSNTEALLYGIRAFDDLYLIKSGDFSLGVADAEISSLNIEMQSVSKSHIMFIIYYSYILSVSFYCGSVLRSKCPLDHIISCYISDASL